MIKLKKIKLKNYCGYRDFELDLTDSDGNIKTWMMSFGPNGVGKSNLIRAVDLLLRPMAFTLKKNLMTFRKMKYHHDYMKGSEPMYEQENDLVMEGIFDVDGEEKRVVLEDNIRGVIFAGRNVDKEKGEISGVKTCELNLDQQGSVFVDADSKSNMHTFQIFASLKDKFCDFAHAVYGLDCYIPDGFAKYDRGFEYRQDFVIKKPDGTKVHYSRFSDGEKKIATLISSLFKRAHPDSPDYENKDILIVDNVELHIYWKRHMTLIKKLEEHFPGKQFIMTTHSPIIINEMDKKYMVDLEEVLKNN